MKSKHTPGPWMVQKNANWVGTDPDGFFTVARCSGSTMSESVENARLIAAAPELLNSLKELESEIEVNYRACFSKGKMHADIESMIDRARLAIVKAEGKLCQKD